jgi:predicted dehydrogenase
MSSRQIKLGLLGCGEITETIHLPVLKNVGEIEVAAFALSDATRRKRIAQRFGIRREYSSAAALLQEKEINAVGIWGPPAEQVAAVTGALSAGKHVFLEKPTFLDLNIFDCLQDHARRHSKMIMFGFPRRWTRAARHARGLIHDGTLGRITTVRTASSQPALETVTHPEWEANHFRVGILFELGIHHFDLLQFLFKVEMNDFHAVTAPGSAAVTARLGDNVLASCVFSENTSGNDEVEIFGSDGRLRFSPYRFDGIEYCPAGSLPGDVGIRARRFLQTARQVPGAFMRAREGGEFIASYRSMWKHFADCVSRGTQPECTIEDGKSALRAVTEAMASARGPKIGLR